MACGAGKSGNPCDRFTPPCSWLKRVISRITDSVNCVAFFEPVSFDMSLRRRALRARTALGALEDNRLFRGDLLYRRLLRGGGLRVGRQQTRIGGGGDH